MQNSFEEHIRASYLMGKPLRVAYVTEACSGCGGSPVCREYCPVEDCMRIAPNPRAPVFSVVEIDPSKCIGCGGCIARGPRGAIVDGCPWDAIVLVDIEEYEVRRGR